MRRLIALLAVAALAMLALAPTAAAKKPDPFYVVNEALLPFDPLPGFDDAEQLWGIHRGAGFRIEVPADWNGDLVMWAHGFRGTGPELTVDNPPFREWLLDNGYAWAASSYTENDYVPRTGAVDTKRLAKHFKRLVDKPDLTYIAGVSMGGHVTAYSIEKWSGQYDGALPACGVLGDYELFDFFLDFNVVAQELSGTELDFPAPVDYLTNAVQTDIKPGLELFPGTFPFTLNAAGEQLKAVTEIQTGGDRTLFDGAFLFWNGFVPDFLFSLGVGDGTLPGSKGKVVLGNTDTVYQFDADPALTAAEQALNDGVLRVAQDPGALGGLAVIKGNIKDPVLTMHTTGDLFVPMHMEQVYADRVEDRGRSHLLVQRAVRDYGHCTFTTAEWETGFSDLVAWVEDGTVPAGDDFRDPAAVAGPAFGCAFTSDDRFYPPPISIAPCP